jgi:hypothetical protein
MKKPALHPYLVQESRDWTPTLIKAACVMMDITLDELEAMLAERMKKDRIRSILEGRALTAEEKRIIEITIGDWPGYAAIIKVPEKGHYGILILGHPFKPGTPMTELEAQARRNRGQD